MGKAASAQSKEGYEKVPVLDAAEEAQFLTSGKETVKAGKPAAPVEERSWESHLCCCFGRCDAVGWGACLVSYFVPCVAFGCVRTQTQIFSRSRRDPSVYFCVSGVALLAPVTSVPRPRRWDARTKCDITCARAALAASSCGSQFSGHYRLPPPLSPRGVSSLMWTQLVCVCRLNMRRGLLLSALKQALIFGILVALSWSLNAVRVATILAECPPALHHMHHLHHGHKHPFGRPFGPGFGRAFASDPASAPVVASSAPVVESR